MKLEGREACTYFYTARTEKRWKAAEMSKKNQIEGGAGIKTIVETASEKKEQGQSKDRVSGASTSAARQTFNH